MFKSRNNVLYILAMSIFLIIGGLQVTNVSAHDFGGDTTGGGPDETPQQPDCKECCGDSGGSSGGGGGPKGPSGTAGDPVLLFNGVERLQVKDMVVNGIYPINIIRKYDSQGTYDTPLGYGWAFKHGRRLYEYPDGSVIIRYGCGQRDRFVFSGGAYVTPQGGLLGQLVEQGDGTFIFTYLDGGKDYYDTEGLLTAQQDTRGNRLEYSYDLRGRLPLTGTSSYAVDPTKPMVVARNHRLEKIEVRAADGVLTGRFVSFAYDETTGRLDTITADDARVVSYIHDVTADSLTQGNLEQVNGLEGVVSDYNYADPNDAHNITYIQEDAGTTPYINVYDTQDRVEQQTHGNDTLVFNYVVPLTQTTVTHTITDAAGANPYSGVTTYDFATGGQVTKVINALGHETRYIYNANMWVERKEIWQKEGTNPVFLLQSMDYTYDTAGNQLTEVVTLDSSEVITTTWTYDNNWVDSKQTVSSANPTKLFRTEYTFYYDGNGDPTNIREKKRRKDDGSFQITTYAYDSKGRLTSTTLPDGVKIINLYEGVSHPYVTKTYYEVGGNPIPQLTQRFDYDTKGNRNKIWDAKDQLTQIEHDDKGRVKKVTNPLLEESIYTYIGKQLRQIENGYTLADGEGQVTKLIYNTEGHLEEIQRKNDADTFVTLVKYTVDSAGNKLTSEDGELRTTRFSYDALNRLKTTTDPLLKVTTFDYDAAGNRISVIDPKLNETQYTYDDLNRLIQMEQLGITPSAVTQYSYNAVDNLLTVTDPENPPTTYEYDALSRKTKEIKPLTQDLQYFYDSRDRLDYMLNARGHKIDYAYYDWGTVDAIRYYADDITPTVDKTVTYGYDDNGNLISVIDDSIQAGSLYTITYDALNRPDITTPGYLPGVSKTLDNDYDRYGNRSTLTFTDGSALVHSYPRNKLNRLMTASLPGSQNFSFSYYNTDELNTITYPGGVNSTVTYQTNGPIKDITTKTSLSVQIEQFVYTHDNNLNIDTFTDNDGLHDYGYDGINRLTQALHPVITGIADENYTHDKVGNREDTVDAALYDYDQNNRIIKSPGITNYTWDDDGNMLTKSDGTTQTYNKQNRLSTYAKDTTSSIYQYDPFGRRITKSVNGTTIWYLWGGNNLIAEYNNTGTRTKRYAYLPNLYAPIQMEDANGVYNVHTDHLDTPIFLTGATQQVVWRATYESFGKAIINDDVDTNGTPIMFNIRFPGQYYDSETNLHYNYYRYYDSETGRYLTSDPIGLAGGLNTYGYVVGNPLYWIDPYGLANTTTMPIPGTGSRVIPGWVKPPSPWWLLIYIGGVGEGSDIVPLPDPYLNEDGSDEKNKCDIERDESRQKGIPDSVIGPSGKPKRHNVDHPSKKKAKDAAKNAGKGKPMHHPSPTVGGPHYHPTDANGNKIPGTHHNY